MEERKEANPGSATTSDESRFSQQKRLRQAILALKPEIISMKKEGYLIRDIYESFHAQGKVSNFNIKQFYYYFHRYIRMPDTHSKASSPAQQQETVTVNSETKKIQKSTTVDSGKPASDDKQEKHQRFLKTIQKASTAPLNMSEDNPYTELNKINIYDD